MFRNNGKMCRKHLAFPAKTYLMERMTLLLSSYHSPQVHFIEPKKAYFRIISCVFQDISRISVPWAGDVIASPSVERIISICRVQVSELQLFFNGCICIGFRKKSNYLLKGISDLLDGFTSACSPYLTQSSRMHPSIKMLQNLRLLKFYLLLVF